VLLTEMFNWTNREKLSKKFPKPDPSSMKWESVTSVI